jgi:hypothetical protein
MKVMSRVATRAKAIKPAGDLDRMLRSPVFRTARARRKRERALSAPPVANARGMLWGATS